MDGLGDGEPGSVAETRSPPPSLLSSVSWTFGTQATVAILALVNVLIVSRTLGPAGRGTVVFLTTISWLTSQIASMSVGQSVSNIPGRRPELRRALAGNAVLLSLALGAVGICALYLLFAVFPGMSPEAGLGLEALALGMIPPMILADYLNRMVFADFGITVGNASLLVASVGMVVFNALLAAIGALTVGSSFAVWCAGQLASLVVVAYYVEFRLAGFGRPDLRLAREMVGFGLKSHGGRVLQLGNYRLDQWLVGAIAGNRELGLYSVAVAWSEGLFILPRALMDAQRPYLIRLDRRAAGAQSSSALRLTMLVTAPIVVVVLLIAPFLCQTIFGSDFHGSIGILRVLALGAFGMAAMKVLGNALIAQDRPLLEGLAVLAAFVATIGLDLILIPSHGGLGAAYASTAAYTVGGLAVAVIAARTLRFPLSSLWPGRADIGEARRIGTSQVRRLLGRRAEAA